MQNQLKELTTEPVKKTKKKKFKKKRIDKAQKANEKKRKREKERAARFNEQYNKWKQEEYEKQKQRREEEYNRRQLKQLQFINSLPVDIISWLQNPTKKGYYMLMKKYHPDKNNNKDNDYAKFITSHWHTVSEV